MMIRSRVFTGIRKIVMVLPWKRGIKRAELVPAAGQDIQLPGTTIVVRGSTIPSTGGDYATIVVQHLNEIQSFALGRQFIHALSAFGKRQIIVYGGQNSNQAAGGAGGYKKLVKFGQSFPNGDKVSFKNELAITLNSSGLDAASFSRRLQQMTLYDWNGGVKTNPFAAMSPANLATMITSWGDGSTAPTLGDQMDTVALALEQWLDNGNGCGTRINYDPHKTQTANGSRPPHVALFHELAHAYYNAMGGQMGIEESSDQNAGGRLFELQAVGLQPFQDRDFSENKFRSELGVNPRLRYP